MTSRYDGLHEQLVGKISFLPDKPEENIESTLRALWYAAAGAPRSAQLAMQGDLPKLSAAQEQALMQLLEQRVSGVPLAHLTGRQQFMGMEMLAGPDALVPRKETELLGAAAIERVRECARSGVRPRVIDACTGSGNVALAVALQVPEAEVFAADLSDSAVELARRNADHLGIGEGVKFSVGDLLAPFDNPDFLGRVNVLTCNPPYIATSNVGRMSEEIAAHEPRLAFDGGALGIGILMRLLKEAPRFLLPGGWLLFEVGLGQGPAIAKRLSLLPAYTEVKTLADHSGAVRVVLARC